MLEFLYSKLLLSQSLLLLFFCCFYLSCFYLCYFCFLDFYVSISHYLLFQMIDLLNHLSDLLLYYIILPQIFSTSLYWLLPKYKRAIWAKNILNVSCKKKNLGSFNIDKVATKVMDIKTLGEIIESEVYQAKLLLDRLIVGYLFFQEFQALSCSKTLSNLMIN